MKTNLIGLIEGLSSQEYHSGPGYSSTELLTMSEGFDLWKAQKGQPTVPTAPMELGIATHLLLEASLKNDLRTFHDAIAVMPLLANHQGALVTAEDLKNKCKDLDLPVKGNKAELIARIREKEPDTVIWDAVQESFIELSKGKLVLSPENHDLCRRMVDAVMKEPDVVGYLRGGISEPSVYVQEMVADQETGELVPLLLKCRPDYLRHEDGLSINFKTTRPGISFEKQAGIMGYDWSSSFYCALLKKNFGRHFDEIHVSVTSNTEGPCRVHLNTIDDEDLGFAESQWRAILARIPKCERTGIWPAPPVNLQSARIPNFAKRICPYV